MKFRKIKNIILPSMLLTLVACGGSDNGSSTASNPNNLGPVVDESVLNEGRGTTSTVASILQWNVTFNEEETSFAAPPGAPGDFVDYFDVDLLAGISDPDGDNLSIKDLTFIWSGPDCANTLVDAVNFPDVCEEILTELGLAAGESVDNIQAMAIRELQNRPVVDEPIYGFDILATSVRVTPQNFAPLLTTGQKAQLGISYVVTDGVSEIPRRVMVIVDGADTAPTFIQTSEDGTPLTDIDGNRIPTPVVSELVSEKFAITALDVANGLFDQDVYDVTLREREIGALEDVYTIGNVYQREVLTIENVTMTTDTGIDVPSGFANLIRQTDPITNVMNGVQAVVNPGVFADLLTGEDTILVTISFDITDGTNATTREAFITVVGANDGNNAPVFFEDLSVPINTAAGSTEIDLISGTLEHESDEISITGFMPTNGTESEFGIFATLDSNTTLVIDPSFFTYLQPGESKTFTYSYMLTDGSLTSEERELEFTIEGTSANLAGRLANADPGFESGSLDASPWRFQTAGAPENLNIIDSDAHSGTYSLQGTEEAIVATLGVEGIQQDQINEDDFFYVSFHAKIVDRAFSVMNVLINKGDDYNPNDSVNLLPVPALGVVNNWMQRVATVQASDYFSPTGNETFSLSMVMQNNAKIDDVSIIKFDRGNRTLIRNGGFNSGSLEGWSATGGTTIEVNAEANRSNIVAGFGLRILNDTGAFQELQLDPDMFPQGSIKRGMRYILQFDMRTPSYTTNAVPIDWRLKEVGGSAVSRRLEFAERSSTLWTTYYIHIDTTTDSRDTRGVLNNQPDFDWENATVQPVLSLRPGDELQIDNIRMYPVPKY